MEFSVSKFETDILGGVLLPRDIHGRHLIRGTARHTPHGVLFNVSVFPTNAIGEVVLHRRLPEDATYNRFPVLYDLIPRICVVGVDADDCYYKAAFALPKFNALTPMDDDDHHPSGGETDTVACPSVSSSPLAAPGVVRYFADEKANGHTVFFRLLPGTDRLLGGTKGCAWMVTLSDGVEDFRAASPTEMVTDALTCMLDMTRGPHRDDVMAVLRTGRVLVAERETNQHIRYYVSPSIMFFDDDLPPAFRKPLSRGPFTPEEVTPELVHELRGGGNWEGWVLRGVDVSGKTQLRIKIKTVSYTCERAGREAYNPADGLQGTLEKWHTRMHDRNQFLHVHPRYLDEVVYVKFLEPLARYLYANHVTRESIAFNASNGLGFAAVIEAFRAHTGLSDDFHLPPPCSNAALIEYAGKKARHSWKKTRERGEGRGTALLVSTAAMGPGSGKSTFMPAASFAVVGSLHMSQDQFAPNANAFYAALEKHLRAKKTVFLHRCCFNARDRSRVLDIVRRTEASVVMVQPQDGVTVLDLYTSLRGVLLRRKHETLGANVPVTTKALVAGSFWCEAAAVDESVEFAGISNATVIPVQMYAHAGDDGVGLTDEVMEGIATFARELHGRKAFDTKTPLKNAEFYSALFKTVCQGPELRRPAQDIARDVVEKTKQLVALHRTPVRDKDDSSCVLYASVDLCAEDSKRLLNDARDAGVVQRGVSTTADHMTLVYKPSLRQADGLSRLVGSRVAITLTSLRCSLDRGIVACGAVVADVAGGSSTPLVEYLPAHGHVTIAWDASKFKPVHSSKLFDGSMADATMILPFERHVVGTVTFHYK
jgi:hypothetical protein